jgi:small nuclear ribonucleoprotein (snRNP)-like protein
MLICETVTGTLKGYDQLMNLVLDDVKELLRGMVHSTL